MSHQQGNATIILLVGVVVGVDRQHGQLVVRRSLIVCRKGEVSVISPALFPASFSLLPMSQLVPICRMTLSVLIMRPMIRRSTSASSAAASSVSNSRSCSFRYHSITSCRLTPVNVSAVGRHGEVAVHENYLSPQTYANRPPARAGGCSAQSRRKRACTFHTRQFWPDLVRVVQPAKVLRTLLNCDVEPEYHIPQLTGSDSGTVVAVRWLASVSVPSV